MSASHKILVVDDNVDAADLTAEYLRVFGADVTVAYGGIGALSAARSMFPDVIILDLGMPVMNGYQVATELRADRIFRNVKIVALTAWNDLHSRKRAAEAGFDFYLTKPADFSILLEVSGLRT